MKKMFVILILPLIFSCSTSTPETVFGLRLGMPFNNEVQSLIAQGQIVNKKGYSNNSDGILCIQYDGYIGVLSCSGSEENENHEKLLDRVFINFANPIDIFPNKINDNITYSNAATILALFQRKYGAISSTIEPGHPGETYIWTKGNLKINLHISKDTNLWCSAWAWYEYTDDIQKEIENKVEHQDSKKY